MLHHLILYRHISQFTAQHLMTTNMQRLAALRADLLRLQQFMRNLLYRQAGAVHFPLPLLFPPLICDLLHWVKERLRPLTGRAKALPPQQAQLLGQPVRLPVQGSNLIFFASMKI